MSGWGKKTAILKAVGKKEDHGNNLCGPIMPIWESWDLQVCVDASFIIPQYAEVPLYIEAKRIISCFYAALSCQPNPLLLNDESELMILFHLLASHLHLLPRRGKPLLAEKPESQITGKEKKHDYDTDRYFNSHRHRRTAHLASQ